MKLETETLCWAAIKNMSLKKGACGKTEQICARSADLKTAYSVGDRCATQREVTWQNVWKLQEMLYFPDATTS